MGYYTKAAIERWGDEGLVCIKTTMDVRSVAVSLRAYIIIFMDAYV